MVEPVAHGVGFGVGEAGLVVQAEEPGPGVQVGGEVRGQHPAPVDVPGLGREVVQSQSLVRTPTGSPAPGLFETSGCGCDLHVWVLLVVVGFVFGGRDVAEHLQPGAALQPALSRCCPGLG